MKGDTTKNIKEKLKEKIESSYEFDGLKKLSSELSIKFVDLQGDDLSAIVDSFIDHVCQHNQVDKLQKKLFTDHPHRHWNDIEWGRIAKKPSSPLGMSEKSRPKVPTRVDKITDYFKNHPVIAPIIVLAMIIGGISVFAEQIQSLGQIFIKPVSPEILDFSSCIELCDGTNSQSVFPEDTTQIHLYWRYENIPIGSHYIRTWKHNGNIWVQYECVWKGPVSGEGRVAPLTEPYGFHSGQWIMTIELDDTIIFQSNPINLEGDNNYWNPVRDPIGRCDSRVP